MLGHEVENNASALCSYHCFTRREHSKLALSLLPLLISCPSEAIRTRNMVSPAVTGMHCLGILGSFAVCLSFSLSFLVCFKEGELYGCGSPSCWHSHSLQLRYFSKTGCIVFDLRASGSKKQKRTKKPTHSCMKYRNADRGMCVLGMQSTYAFTLNSIHG